MTVTADHLEALDHETTWNGGGTANKLVVVTDTWHPQVNGVVTALTQITQHLERDGWEVIVMHPGLFRSVPLPWYPELRLAVAPGRGLRRVLIREAPDYVHLATEGLLGWNARVLCRRYGWRFTTSYHTNFQLYAHMRARPLLWPVPETVARLPSRGNMHHGGHAEPQGGAGSWRLPQRGTLATRC